ncbi:MAG: ImmA/IrrE family metallo-endopeptidase [Candidatus Magasanikbacteria bacterium]|jgi:Zn-dependent peptidase ImmA (M78 family)|nr:ImmA/IrrE family metallo-endopeptidase [Candidatus Magasanikbacteria bacterium]MBT4220743.1 ImmA/IrrE family metallo-endopeptidase [Candidatus Magasanikbacteria bacterium]MBT4350088.1 ImmA/IrrE family metallo-endopeptidase [Candidatus Magasanikbacteria bacterium]MBT4541469.1 ImmA/IrrE family metallo-endopeptidase [Candidatus Magasanikbacteria bacterium]MBT6252997.1 ImmA/IrrE family metallo-endopeptidase [Candidatus Magasanikbacteria bacterium]
MLPIQLPEHVRSLFEGQFPVPVVDIATALDIKMYTTDDLSPSQSGVIVKEQEDYTIVVNETHSPERIRFTVAHEIGHFLMHKDILDEQRSFISDIKQPAFLHDAEGAMHRAHDHRLPSKDRTLELEANKFAADLLMPKEQFTKVWDVSNTIDEVAAFFNVSISAATVRGEQVLNSFMV